MLMIRTFGLLLITAITATLFFWWQLQSFSTRPMNLPEQGLVYNVAPGTGVGSLAENLEKQDVISSSFYFRTMVSMQGKGNSIKAGEFFLPTGTTPLVLLEILSSGRVMSHALTLVEGWTFLQVLEAIRSHDAIQQTFAQNIFPEQLMEKLEIDEINPEGRFLADTYHFPRGTTDIEFLKRAYREMNNFIDAEWQARAENLPLKSPYEALILASIIEKETGVAEERPAIAGVFVRRLRKGMRLQTDPTVIYGMGENYNGNIRRADLKTDTPYNTYLHAGLPPTPISMPGKEAIRAALHPASGKTLYFVATGNGGHYFSATLDEHNQAVRKYQLHQ